MVVPTTAPSFAPVVALLRLDTTIEAFGATEQASFLAALADAVAMPVSSLEFLAIEAGSVIAQLQVSAVPTNTTATNETAGTITPISAARRRTIVSSPRTALCNMGISAIWASVQYGHLCNMGICAIWVSVQYGYLCNMGICAIWASV